MRSFEKFSLLFWGLVLLTVAANIGYLLHFQGMVLVWDFIHMFGHPAGWLGMTAMALSLLYIGRKKKWFTKGKIRTWYRAHVILGMIGPILIAFHAYGKYYGFGGLAFVIMWLVLLTGIIGHFLVRRLPEEVRARAEERKDLLTELDRLEKKIQELASSADMARSRIDEESLLIKITEADKVKLPKAVLAKEPGRIIDLWRDYRQGRRELSNIKQLIRDRARAEHRVTDIKAEELMELLRLEYDVRRLVSLHELFSLWRTCHVPLSWLMWWVAALHLFSWIYY